MTMMRKHQLSSLLAALLVACGPSNGADKPDAAPGPDAAATDAAAPDAGIPDAAPVDAAAPDAATGPILGDPVDLGVTGERLDLARDAAGDLHLAYSRDWSIYYLNRVGGLWGAERQVPGAEYATFNNRWPPRIAADSQGGAHLAWAGGSYEFVYYQGWDGSFTTLETVITDDTPGGDDTNRCDITVDQSDAVVVVAQSDYAIQYNRKPAGGAFLGEQDVWAHTPDEPAFPSVGASLVSDELFCVYSMDAWPDQGLQYNRWTQGAWEQPPLRPGDSGGPCCPNWIQVTVDADGNPHLAWVIWKSDTEAYSDLLYIRRLTSGDWSPLQTLVSETELFSCWLDECPIPQVAVTDNGAVLVVYADGHESTSRARYFLKLPGELAWPATPADLQPETTYQNHPMAVAVGNTFHVVWSDEGEELFHRTILIP